MSRYLGRFLQSDTCDVVERRYCLPSKQSSLPSYPRQCSYTHSLIQLLTTFRPNLAWHSHRKHTRRRSHRSRAIRHHIRNILWLRRPACSRGRPPRAREQWQCRRQRPCCRLSHGHVRGLEPVLRKLEAQRGAFWHVPLLCVTDTSASGNPPPPCLSAGFLRRSYQIANARLCAGRT